MFSPKSEITNPNTVVQHDNGSLQCKDIRDNSAHDLNPETCYSVQRKTLASDNPCGCSQNGGQCVDTVQSNGACSMCPSGKIIGDDNRMIPAFGHFPQFTCGELKQYASLAFDGSTCPLAKADAAAFCQCVYPGQSFTPCVANDLEHAGQSDCNGSSTCCNGFCQYRGNYGLVCSTRHPLSADQWPTWAFEETGFDHSRYGQSGYNPNGGGSGATRGVPFYSITMIFTTIVLFVFGWLG